MINQPTFDGYLCEGTDVMYANARNYESATGSFLEVDPLNPISSPYSYCFGNPVMLRDPTGLDPTSPPPDDGFMYWWNELTDEWEPIGQGVEVNPGIHDSPSYGSNGGWPEDHEEDYSFGSYSTTGSGRYENGRDWENIDAVVIFHFSDIPRWFMKSSLTTKLLIDMGVATFGIGITTAGSVMESEAYQQIQSFKDFLPKLTRDTTTPGSYIFSPAYKTVLQGMGFWYSYLAVASSMQIAGVTLTTTSIGCATYYYQCSHPEQYQYIGKVGWW